jgi:hypothetical protein
VGWRPQAARAAAHRQAGRRWLPSLPYLQAGDLERSNWIIDQAAEAAGRDPRAIRRLVNLQGIFAGRNGGFLQGPPEQWVEELLPLVLEDGVSRFILSSDDPRALERSMPTPKRPRPGTRWAECRWETQSTDSAASWVTVDYTYSTGARIPGSTGRL